MLNKRLYLLTIFGIFFFNFSSGQALIKNYVQTNAIRINSIDINDTSYIDLEDVGKAIGDSRIVMLGEQDHGDAPTFKAKARLIKYLHEKLGFNVIVYESDFYGLTSGMDAVAAGKLSIDSLIKNNIFYVWTATNEAYETFNYISSAWNTSNRLKVAGMDYLAGNGPDAYTEKNFAKEYTDFLESANIPFIKSAEYQEKEFSSLIDSVFKYRTYSISNTQSKKVAAKLVRIFDIISLQLKDYKKDDYWMKVTEVFQNHLYWMNGKGIMSRDEMMASNLTWLSKVKYPNEKILVWAADAHIAKGLFKSGRKPMGEYLSGMMDPKEFYVLGFVSLQGTYGRVQYKNKIQIPRTEVSSLEYWINEKAYDFAFIDFREFNKLHKDYKDKFFMSPEAHYQSKSTWTTKYDGVFYIKEMYPVSRKL